MGQVAACGDLHKYDSACEMSVCTESVNGLPGDTGSPSDQWIINFTKGTVYEKMPISQAFLKLWVSPKTVKDFHKNEEVTCFTSVVGLDYERKIYKIIIRDVLDFEVCPNFVKYLGDGVHCSYADVYNLANTKNWQEKQNKRHDQEDGRESMDLNWHLQRNITYMLNEIKKRPGIYEDEIDKNIIKKPTDIQSDFIKHESYEEEWKWYMLPLDSVKKYTYDLLVNESMGKDMKCAKFFTDILDINDESVEVWRVIFQIMVACYTMSLCKMTHNDLHLNNIYVVKLPDEKNFVYNINNNVYAFKSSYLVKVYDFDRSYAQQLGRNPVLDDVSLELDSFSQTNDLFGNRDAIKIWAFLYYAADNETKNKILKICVNKTKTNTDDGSDIRYSKRQKRDAGVSKNTKDVQALFNYKNSHNLSKLKKVVDKKGKKKKKEVGFDVDDYDKFSSIESMLESVSTDEFAKTSNISLESGKDCDYYSMCNPGMFDEEGRLTLLNESLGSYRTFVDLEFRLQQDKSVLLNNIKHQCTIRTQGLQAEIKGLTQQREFLKTQLSNLSKSKARTLKQLGDQHELIRQLDREITIKSVLISRIEQQAKAYTKKANKLKPGVRTK